MNKINLNPLELYKRGIIVDKFIPTSEVLSFINFIKKSFKPVKLIRIGSQNDGGYLFPDIFSDISYCFSPGVSKISSFEDHLSKTYNIKSFLADANIEAPTISNKNFYFTKKFISSIQKENFITLSNWINQSIHNDYNNLFLQMDVEGHEYDILIKEDLSVLNRFIGMIIEFHWLQKIFDRFSFKMISSIFSKILENFYIVHIHPNNCCGIIEYDSVQIPLVSEFSFLRKDYLKKVVHLNSITLPHKLDRPNIKEKHDLILPDIWWK